MFFEVQRVSEKVQLKFLLITRWTYDKLKLSIDRFWSFFDKKNLSTENKQAKNAEVAQENKQAKHAEVEIVHKQWITKSDQ